MKVIVVLPAYNAEQTLIKTYNEIPLAEVDEILLVDDKSQDSTVKLASELGLTVIQHSSNLGYGANQKTCYNEALKRGADIVVMLHPDFQYDPKLIPAMVEKVKSFDLVLGSRFLTESPVKQGMPKYKYVSNRFLTWLQNKILKQNLSEYHTGYRAYQRQVLERIDYNKFSDDFIFDNQMLVSAIRSKFSIGEIACPTKYEKDSSNINLLRSIKYGLGVIRVTLLHR
ncbi:glycosyltransferase family 2 protein [Candidatus Falkowbacteria bacterium]|jgi:glycosyltransferase involved in cell wall biosynthesis|nr:glycosyltransferase family 2 protein [Candidatus Falkowbacteria bacterium]MBT5503651.1 glycosyltransferase family 2 protein [Candidatus Falkowbacteria bacterium]MBT6574115.1 glycosyltransferase family 2 protein [Candidatus Falkowbacteria bacterium]MBT7500679.1 glycosyltransferase family 2 protein [Candidatus Falkowbacteria bacterium]